MPRDLTTLHVRNAIGGDPAAVEWLVSHFHSLVVAQVRLRLRGHGTSHDVEDLAADVWTVVLRRLARLQPREGRHAPVMVRFLGTTVLQTCNNFLRKRARQRLVDAMPAEADSSPAEPMDRIAAETRGVMTRAIERELCAEVGSCLDRLKPAQRDVLLLRLMEQRNNREIAQLLKIPANTVAVRYRRALETLRNALPADVWGEVRSATAAISDL